jgi:thiol-disulfide isomerase/thioredoxin
MGRLRQLARRAVERVARVVAKDDLFEKPGERAPSTPLAPRSAAPSGAATPNQGAPRPEPAPTAAPAEPPAPAAPRTDPPSAAAPAPAAAAPAAPRGEATPTSASRPKEGCVPVDLAGLRAALTPSGKPLVVNHWATWCDPCVDELPRLVRAAAGVADLGEFIGVSWDLFDHPGKPATVARNVARFADSAGIGYASVLFTGAPEELFAACGLDMHQIPQTLVIAPDGRVVYHKKGVVDHDDVFPLIAAVKGARG